MRNTAGRTGSEVHRGVGQVLGDCQGCNTHKRQVLECIDCLGPLSASVCPYPYLVWEPPFVLSQGNAGVDPRTPGRTRSLLLAPLSDYPSLLGTRGLPVTLAPFPPPFFSFVAALVSLVFYTRESCPGERPETAFETRENRSGDVSRNERTDFCTAFKRRMLRSTVIDGTNLRSTKFSIRKLLVLFSDYY